MRSPGPSKRQGGAFRRVRPRQHRARHSREPETVFQSGSMGKQFTAMLVMILIEENKLSLDDLISKYLTVPSTWAGISVRHQLTHTSGLGDYPEGFSLQKNYTEDEL